MPATSRRFLLPSFFFFCVLLRKTISFYNEYFNHLESKKGRKEEGGRRKEKGGGRKEEGEWRKEKGGGRREEGKDWKKLERKEDGKLNAVERRNLQSYWKSKGKI